MRNTMVPCATCLCMQSHDNRTYVAACTPHSTSKQRKPRRLDMTSMNTVALCFGFLSSFFFAFFFSGYVRRRLSRPRQFLLHVKLIISYRNNNGKPTKMTRVAWKFLTPLIVSVNKHANTHTDC